MSDKATDLIARDHLATLLQASATPEGAAHTIPRTRLARQGAGGAVTVEMDVVGEGSISPLAILFVFAMLVTLFIAIVKVS